MGNCETCEGLDRKSDMNIMLINDPLNQDNNSHQEELPADCPPLVREIYNRLGAHRFNESYPYEWRDPVVL
jgi:hypothetical protein